MSPAMRARVLLFALPVIVASTGCMSARLSGPPPVPPPELQPPPVVVVVEPFFENAAEETREVTQRQTGMDVYGVPREVEVTSQVIEKPLYARLSSLSQEHQQVRAEIQRLRPQWKVISTGDLPAISGQVRLIRVVVGDHEIAGSDRAFKRIATMFGIVIWPLLFVNVTPVTEVDRVHGTVTLYDANAEDLRARLLRYPTQPDFAIDTRGLAVNRVQPVTLDIEYQEGLMANENDRPPVLIDGFSQRLAVAVVALVEGIQ